MASTVYEVLAPEEGKDGKTYWNKVGAAFTAKDGEGFNIKLFALPLNGKLILRVRRNFGDQRAPRVPALPTAPPGRAGGDDIPF